MSVSDFAEGDLFVIRVVKYLSTNPSDKWANSYEFRATTIGHEAELLVLGEHVSEFEAEFHFSQVVFDRILISTWEEDSKPYDPSVFISSTLTGTGGIAGGGQLLGLQNTLSIARIASTGRFGHLFYRACLEELDVTAPAGKTVLVDRAAQQAKIDAALTSSSLDVNIAGGGGPLEMVMINKTGTQVRPIQQLRVQGVAGVKTDHKWFNRTTPTP